MPTVILIEEPTSEIRQAISGPLKQLNDVRAGRSHRFTTFALTLTAPGMREVIGGLWAEAGRGYLYVDLLFVPEAIRGQGVGRRLIRQAEQEGLRRACHAVWLTTYSFQAPGFYQKLGYRVFGELPEFPRGHRTIFLTKMLDPVPG